MSKLTFISSYVLLVLVAYRWYLQTTEEMVGGSGDFSVGHTLRQLGLHLARAWAWPGRYVAQRVADHAIGAGTLALFGVVSGHDRCSFGRRWSGVPHRRESS